MVDSSPWWRSAVIYQVYPRSFADGNGDGIGDVAGIRSRLDHLAALGVDAIWYSPWYPSPMADAGYDVSDYRDIDPVFGTLGEVEALITEAHALGIRTIVDVVPNHCSDAHPWFRAALAGGPDAPERELFWFRAGRGPGGDLPPTDWTGEFGGPTWTRTTDPDGTPGDWYLHLFAPQQPDFNWDHPRVRAEFEDILRFWFDRGVDGIRIDSAGLLVKDGTLPEVHPDRPHPFRDLDGVHDVYRAWRRIADSYPGQRALVGEVWLPDRQRFANYLRPDELHTAFNFDFLGCAWDAVALRESIDGTLAAHAPVGAPATWVLSNHDVTRHVTRYGRADTTFSFAAKREGIPTDLELGTRRARAAALLSLALPGAAYVYQGEELGLWEVEDIPYELRQDPMWERSGRVDPGRDGCRVPLPWQGDTPPFGFSPDGATVAPWLPQPADWKDRTVRAQAGDPHSMLELYRAALALRRASPSLGDGALTWLPAPDRVLAFAREPGLTCVVNLGDEAVPLPAYDRLLLASGPLDDDRLPADTAVWLRTRSA
ncbi:glycoside hydrolase family 13 protein [Micromonospora sp. WMMD1128]|uniref:glycoside hydrolase family 13 protein n=1 Tax=unclassified Micromonospora TaxID=2617518 RepID=UPI00248C97DE|nr:MULTISPECIES: glycoside hydrolase family 13 protein [unclassified Micromonospora]WBB77054.1 glycoside hydrolase family 13 protein [Micromonospora sp. WMMD1128]WFE36654.1 glycoside hydrolase family 13 protein [Micromonospora sp. WMMD975]